MASRRLAAVGLTAETVKPSRALSLSLRDFDQCHGERQAALRLSQAGSSAQAIPRTPARRLTDVDGFGCHRRQLTIDPPFNSQQVSALLKLVDVDRS